MKKIFIVTGFIALTVGLISCKDKRSTGRAYMPDMAYSVAYETYAPAEERLKNTTAEGDPYYNGKPVEGTMARGDMASYHLKNDTSDYKLSAFTKSPLTAGSVDLKEAERLYLVNCGICHGTKLDGNGPLYNDGNGPYSAAPKNFMGDDMKKMAEGTMFQSVTYGKGQMGSYASQLNTKQRWMVIAYVKHKQFPEGGSVGGASTDSTGTQQQAGAPKTMDSASVKKPV